ncbi:MAG: hypothetical protein D3926_08185 [Desulfobacteraceae bacterium]|nr:MAG: hypothetical protein D3926_08185 [Desulfobacteraceae bacterium]
MRPSKFNSGEYLSFMGLETDPFDKSPAKEDIWLSDLTRAIIDDIAHCVFQSSGLMLLTGETGSGKTLILEHIADRLFRGDAQIAAIDAAVFQVDGLLWAIGQEIGLTETDLNVTRQMESLEQLILAVAGDGKVCALIIDNAQHLSEGDFELIDHLSGLKSGQNSGIQIILSGNLELADRFHSRPFKPLKERLHRWHEIKDLTAHELATYVRFRLTRAGDQGQITVEKQAMTTLYKMSRGNIGRINRIMDQALHHAFMEQTLTVRKKFVEDVFIETFSGESEFKRNPVFLTVLVVLCASLIGIAGITLFRYQKGSQTTDTPLLTPDIVISKSIPEPEKVPQAEPPDDPPAHQTGEPAPIIPPEDPVLSFLKAYHLQIYEPEFSKALESGQLEAITRQIHSDTGLALVSLQTMPESIKKSFHMLAINTGPSEEVRYHLFWEPDVIIPSYYKGYRGNEIKTLQGLLKEQQLYQHTIDGIVGDQSTRGLKQFQKLHGLDPTGQPDFSTLFLLSRLGTGSVDQ